MGNGESGGVDSECVVVDVVLDGECVVLDVVFDGQDAGVRVVLCTASIHLSTV